MHVANGNSKKPASVLAVSVLAATFLLGGITGMGVAWWTRDKVPHARPPGPLPLEELDLTDAQETKVREIFKRYHPEFDAIFRSTFPRVKAINERLEAEVRQVLDDQQRKQLDALKGKRPAFPPPPGHWGPPPDATRH